MLFAEFYENARSNTAHMLDFKAELRAEGGRVVQAVNEERASTEVRGRAAATASRRVCHSTPCEPGLYVLHVEGRSRANQDAVVSRDIQIRVR